MFYYLNGTLTYRSGSVCVIDCGGVGYQLTVSMITSGKMVNKLGQPVKLYTWLSVREDGMELFGFGSAEERVCFQQLTSVSGVGPKAAMSILSTMSADELSLAVCTEDIKAISRSPGIGNKTAARIVLELKDKMSKDMMGAGGDTATQGASSAAHAAGPLSDATEALMMLGYDKNTVLGALKGIDPAQKDAGELIKAALKKLAR